MSKRIYQYARPIVLCPNHLDEDMLEDCLFCRIAELQEQVDRTCTWKRQKLGTDWDEYDSWGTSCGEDFAIVEEWHDRITPYCSNCGGKVIEKQKP